LKSINEISNFMWCCKCSRF